MPRVKPEEEACPLCGELVAAKRQSGAWEFTCEGQHATGNALTWTWEGDLGVEPSVPSWLRPTPLTAAQQAKADKKVAADAAKAEAAAAEAVVEPEAAAEDASEGVREDAADQPVTLPADLDEEDAPSN
jgi:ubiquitin